jgi:hypothetical protein
MSSTSDSNFARVSFIARCFGPLASAVMNGRLISGLHHRGELHLRLLRGLAKALQRHAVLAEIDAVALAELVDDPLDDALIEVVATEVRVAVGRLHLDDASPTSRIEMSNVPPPKSYTAMVSSFFLSRP